MAVSRRGPVFAVFAQALQVLTFLALGGGEPPLCQVLMAPTYPSPIDHLQSLLSVQGKRELILTRAAQCHPGTHLSLSLSQGQL